MARILVFAFDLAESAQIRRIRSLIAAGHHVTSASMRRSNMNAGFDPDWPDIPLFVTENERLARRIAVILGGILKMWRHRRAVASADAVIARNFDMALIAWASLLGLKRRPALVYECLDIHGLFTCRGVLGAVMRWCERRLLGRIDLLLTSSPGFVRSYFAPVQHYGGPIAILENKLWFDGDPLPRPACPAARGLRWRNAPPDRPAGTGDAVGVALPERPLVLGWVGSIRCATSLALLLEAADRLGPRLRIEIHGNVHEHAIPQFFERIAERPNLGYHGSYAYPGGLAAIYRGCDLVWAQDLWQRGGNSDWLLPNRIYEASWFGCPSIAVADTETGRRVDADGLGFTIARPDAPDLLALLEGLGREEIEACSARLLARDGRDFRLDLEDVVAALAPVLPRSAPHAATGEEAAAIGSV